MKKRASPALPWSSPGGSSSSSAASSNGGGGDDVSNVATRRTAVAAICGDDGAKNMKVQRGDKGRNRTGRSRNNFPLFFVWCGALWSVGALLAMASKLYSASQTVDPCLKAELSMRQLRLLSSSAGASEKQEEGQHYFTTLPKIIHQQWRERELPVGSKFEKWHQAWLEKFPKPEYEHVLWTDDDAENLIREHYSWFLPTYLNYIPNIKRVDAARYFILHRYGGVYADMDYEPLTNFYARLPKDRVGFVESPHRYMENHQNSLMSSPKGHPLWEDVAFGMLVERKDMPVLHATGPLFVDAVVES